jgi:hypothetical protein
MIVIVIIVPICIKLNGPLDIAGATAADAYVGVEGILNLPIPRIEGIVLWSRDLGLGLGPSCVVAAIERNVCVTPLRDLPLVLKASSFHSSKLNESENQ